MLIGESDEFDIGSGQMFWSIKGGQKGYFYSNNNTRPLVAIANVTDSSACGVEPGYRGLSAVQELRDAAALAYIAPARTLVFGTRLDGCFQGLLVYKQGDQYGVIDFLSVDGMDRLDIRFWVGDPGVTDFSRAPSAEGHLPPGSTATAPVRAVLPQTMAPAALPPGTKVTCLVSASSLDDADCPVLRWGGYTYWAFSYLDNRAAMNITAYDGSGRVVKQIPTGGRPLHLEDRDPGPAAVGAVLRPGHGHHHRALGRPSHRSQP